MSGADNSSGAENAAIPLEDLILDLDEVARHGPGPHMVTADLPTNWVTKVLLETEGEAGEPGRAALLVQQQGDGTVLLRGDLELAYSVPCARCLDPASVDASCEVCVTAVPAARLRGEIEQAQRATTDPEGVELDGEELDRIGFEGKKIDVGRVLSEQTLLSYPIRALCSLGEACRGLCPKCGTSLNLSEGPCQKCGFDPDSAQGASDEGELQSEWKAALRKLTQS
jgi:uncharacterized metal-binding protein YceD (DUF177 family)